MTVAAQPMTKPAGRSAARPIAAGPTAGQNAAMR